MRLGIIAPIYYQIVKKEGDKWKFYGREIFYKSPNAANINLKEPETYYGLTLTKIAIELFRINAGRDGYYLANLKDKKYYYCGLELADVRTTLHELGIGRPDPVKY